MHCANAICQIEPCTVNTKRHHRRKTYQCRYKYIQSYLGVLCQINRLDPRLLCGHPSGGGHYKWTVKMFPPSPSRSLYMLISDKSACPWMGHQSIRLT